MLHLEKTPADAHTWNSWVASFPAPHMLQTWQWGEIKSHFGWRPIYRVWKNNNGDVIALAQVLERALPVFGSALGLQVMYVPRGPLLRTWETPQLRRQVLDDLKALAQERGAIFIKIDPEVWLSTGFPGEPDAQDIPVGKEVVDDFQALGWCFSPEQIQFPNTIQIDLNVSEDELLGRMKQKARYNIRLSSRKKVTVRHGDQADLGLLYQMYAQTSARDGFIIRQESYYRTVWETFYKAGMADILIAEVESEPVAGVVIIQFEGTAWYVYGMSTGNHKEKMPTYLLQWEAICRARSRGCQVYDLWGAPTQFQEGDALWGVYRFKAGLGGKIIRYIGAWDFPVHKLYYSLYTQLMPRLMGILRKRGRQQTQTALGL